MWLYVILEPQTSSSKWMLDVWLNNHFRCKDLVHPPIDSQPFKKWMFQASRWISFATVQASNKNPSTPQPWKTSLLIFSKDASNIHNIFQHVNTMVFRCSSLTFGSFSKVKKNLNHQDIMEVHPGHDSISCLQSRRDLSQTAINSIPIDF